MRKNKGFTLIEILVALLIFAIMGVLAAKSLRDVIRIHTRLKKDDHHTMQLIMTMTLMRRDIENAINRPVRDAAGQKFPAFSGQGNAISFTRGGLLNPFNNNRRSNMVRIGYVLDGKKLERLTWDSLDTAKDAKPNAQVLLSDVDSIHWSFIASNDKRASIWPMPKSKSNAAAEAMQTSNPTAQQTESVAPIAPLPKVVLMTLRLHDQGIITGVYAIPGQGVSILAPSTQPTS